jgi:hypothetical protein
MARINTMGFWPVSSQCRSLAQRIAAGTAAAMIAASLAACGGASTPASSSQHRRQARTHPTSPGASPLDQPSLRTTVPHVTGIALNVAYQRLRAADLRVTFTGPLTLTPTYSCFPDVAHQSSAAGQHIAAGSTVMLDLAPQRCVVAKPGHPTVMPSATVPNLVGKPLTAAIAWADAHQLAWAVQHLPGLASGHAPSFFANYAIDAQQPQAGRRLQLEVVGVNGARYTPLTLRVSP